ncbi:nuclear transport factor 2 family protein [Streptomyces parvulus]|uniref:nuclear transport factor 2 family protein n=1 Tax=Streptomyces parvulus TaxID=146923 RepID=UPI0015F10A8B|nr:nuclear transport factor 2 family protein [Streptomyces parvulus]
MYADTDERSAVRDTLVRMGWYVDRRNWEGLAGEVFAETLRVDYTSLWGGEPEDITGREQTDRWAKELGRLDSTQHVITGVLVTVDGDEATASANVQATLVRRDAAEGPLWANGGTYTTRMRRGPEGWRITALVTELLWESGNSGVLTDKS